MKIKALQNTASCCESCAREHPSFRTQIKGTQNTHSFRLHKMGPCGRRTLLKTTYRYSFLHPLAVFPVTYRQPEHPAALPFAAYARASQLQPPPP
ncbi:hypothetical protein E2C01_059749 [Portunus trituberculatus]|uniref:Uncharacterized protein n=1 Tax=Portunus trituberculatus TaxID=210409 RepID=A0A5B7GZ91_PORTR|nr:hypothetical protein [Portunus trituberculatus]